MVNSESTARIWERQSGGGERTNSISNLEIKRVSNGYKLQNGCPPVVPRRGRELLLFIITLLVQCDIFLFSKVANVCLYLLFKRRIYVLDQCSASRDKRSNEMSVGCIEGSTIYAET